MPGSAELPMDHTMSEEAELLNLLKSRMLQPRDYCVLLATPVGMTPQVRLLCQCLNYFLIQQFSKTYVQ